MINAKLNLVLLLLNEETFKYHIVSSSEISVVLPSIDIGEFQDIDASIRLLLTNYLDITEEESMNFDYRLIDINVQDILNIYYFTVISHDIETINSYKLPLKQYEFNLPNLSKILQRLQ
jgi:hypothetical protein